MKFEEFQKTLDAASPPGDLSGYLKSLWYDAKGDWNRSHEIIQNIEDLPAGRQDKTAEWIHAYLHRKEGDIGNADYWYRRAGKSRPDQTTNRGMEDYCENFALIEYFVS
jgi:hypothetical protein